MGEASHQTGWCLAYGVVVHASEDGLVVEGDRIQRVRLHDAELEARIVDALKRSGDLGALSTDASNKRLSLAVERLRAVGAIVPVRAQLTMIDLLGIDARVRAKSVVRAETAADIAPSDLTLLVGRRTDAALGECIARCHAIGNEALVVWTSPGEVIAVIDDPKTAPCALCALGFDGRAPRLSADLPFRKLASVASDHDGVERLFASSVVSRYASATSPLAPGRASVWDVRNGTASLHDFPRHPACACRERKASASCRPTPTDWDALERARFRPVTPLTDAGLLAHVAYRGARSPWPLTQSTFGIAIAEGDGRRERAIAEGIERFAMLHAPADERPRARRDLDEEALSSADIASLLFRDDEYRVGGFRFPRFDDTIALEWSRATRASSGEHVLVPTSLAGRPSEASVRLVDGTSNGYAAHHSRDEAKQRALLEVIERDALLLRWYTSDTLARVVDVDAPNEVIVMLATADIDLPVVVAAACLPEGSLRIGSAAAPTFDIALRRALSELDGQMMGAPIVTRPDLARTDRGFGPRDHLAHYSGDNGRALLDAWMHVEEIVSARELRDRWSEVSRPLDRMVEAVSAVGLDVLFVDRSLPDLFGDDWFVVRALVPGAVEMSWGMAYRRLASPRIANRLANGSVLSSCPHPYA